MRCRSLKRILQYHMPNKLLFPENFSHHVLLLFYPFRDKKQLLSGFPPIYQNKLQEKGVQDAVNINKIKSWRYGDLVDNAFSRYNENVIKNQDPQSQIENDDTPAAEDPNKDNSEDTKTNKTSAIPNFMSKILQVDEITEGIKLLNSKKSEVFNVVHTWA